MSADHPPQHDDRIIDDAPAVVQFTMHAPPAVSREKCLRGTHARPGDPHDRDRAAPGGVSRIARSDMQCALYRAPPLLAIPKQRGVSGFGRPRFIETPARRSE